MSRRISSPGPEWKTYTTLKRLDNLETLKALFYSHAYGRHFHDSYALGVILQGSETYACNHKTNVAPQGSVVVVNPGEVHDGQASDIRSGWGYFMIYPRLSLVKKALAQLELSDQHLPIFPESVIFDPAFSFHLIRFMESVEAGDSRLTLETRFLEMLGLLITRHARFSSPPAIAGTTTDGRVSRVMELIRQGFDTPLSLEGLALEAGMSPWALLRRFKAQTGLTPYLVQTRLRLDQAKKAISTGMSPAHAAALCGFSDQSHMTRQFRKWMGITPGDIVRASGRVHPEPAQHLGTAKAHPKGLAFSGTRDHHYSIEKNNRL